MRALIAMSDSLCMRGITIEDWMFDKVGNVHEAGDLFE